jgi:hypothetical protein
MIRPFRVTRPARRREPHPPEAIFLSTFVTISQNRADAKREVIANQQWTTVQEEDKQNEDSFGCRGRSWS